MPKLPHPFDQRLVPKPLKNGWEKEKSSLLQMIGVILENECGTNRRTWGISSVFCGKPEYTSGIINQHTLIINSQASYKQGRSRDWSVARDQINELLKKTEILRLMSKFSITNKSSRDFLSH